LAFIPAMLNASRVHASNELQGFCPAVSFSKHAA
jgi:hypothetical protein